MAYLTYGVGTETELQLGMLSAKVNISDNPDDFTVLHDWSYYATFQATVLNDVDAVTNLSGNTTKSIVPILRLSMNGTATRPVWGSLGWVLSSAEIRPGEGLGSTFAKVSNTYVAEYGRKFFNWTGAHQSLKLFDVNSEDTCGAELVSMRAETQMRNGVKNGPNRSSVTYSRDVLRVVIERKHYNVTSVSQMNPVLCRVAEIDCTINGTEEDSIESSGYSKFVLVSQELIPYKDQGSLMCKEREEYIGMTKWEELTWE